jgi:hypothetical protein
MWFGFGWLVACVWRTREEAREGSRKTNMEEGGNSQKTLKAVSSQLASAFFSIRAHILS